MLLENMYLFLSSYYSLNYIFPGFITLVDKLGAHLANIYLHYWAFILTIPSHCTGTFIFNITKIELSEELIPISNPVYMDELSENVHSVYYWMDIIPSPFTMLTKWQLILKSLKPWN